MPPLAFRTSPGARIRCHEKYAAGEVDFAVVSERKGRLIKNSQQELPKGVICLLDFIEQKKLSVLAQLVLTIASCVNNGGRLACPGSPAVNRSLRGFRDCVETRHSRS